MFFYFKKNYKILCLGILFIGVQNAFSQKEANNWCFGSYAALNFNSGTPVALTYSKMLAVAGSSTMSEQNGNLLFYSNGQYVWNRNNDTMLNGKGLDGSLNATQSGLIVPLPGNNHIFYIFTISGGQLGLGLSYSIIDMNLDGGLGAVSIKNIHLLSNTTEKITAIRHTNNSAIWIITHKWNTNAFYAYLLSSSGLNTNPVISYSGKIHGPNNVVQGYMKASSDGKKIAVAVSNAFSQLFNFNPTTGVVSNPINLKYKSNNIAGGFGVEFSPNGKFLYLSIPDASALDTSFILQYNVQNYDSVLINQSCNKIAISVHLQYRFYALQIAPDRKIYSERRTNPYIDVINNPNKPGASCNYVNNALYLNGRAGLKGLPTFMQSYFFVPDFTAKPLCYGDSTHFSISDTTQYDSVSWNFGNIASGIKNISKLSKPIHKFTDTGTYRVVLVIFHNSTSDTTYRDIKISPPPNVSFTVNDSIQCLKSNLFGFTNASTIQSGSMTWEWDFGDNSTYYKHDTAHSYLSKGTYKVKLIALSDYGCTDSFQKNVQVISDPVSSFTVNDSDQCISGNSFIFTNKTSGIYNSFWKFGDGNTDTTTSPVHSYLIPGTFTVKLNVVNDQGCKDSTTHLVKVIPGSVPKFGINKKQQCLSGNNYIFTDSSTISSGTITKHEWNFGDGTKDTILNTFHSYSKAGTYKVTLLTTTNIGCKDSITKQIIVLPMPKANFTAYDSIQCLERNNFAFSNKSSSANSSLTYLWNFGDSITSTLFNPNHSYNYAATFTTKLVVEDTFGCKDSIDKTTRVHVHPEPLSAFTIDDSSQCLRGNKFNFTNNSTISSGKFTQLWNYGDGDTTSSYNSNHSYTGPDTFKVKLLLVSDWGCKDSILHKVFIQPQPKADFTVNDSLQCMNGNNFVFTNLSQKLKYGSQTYNWKFGDGVTDTATNPNHSYLTDSSYIVKLKAISDMGCMDSVSKTIFVNPNPKSAYSVNDNTQCLSGNLFAFTNNTTIKAGTYSQIWSFADGFDTTSINANHSYSLADSYMVKLLIVSGKGCKDSVQKQVIVYPEQNTGFTISDSSVCFGQIINYTNTSIFILGTLNFKWDFGDGGRAFTQNTQHLYTNDSVFDVKLVSTSNFGCKDSITHKVYINPYPKADFVINDTVQCLKGNSFTFANSSIIKTGSIVHYNFELGDGFKDTLASVVHSYLKADSFFVKLLVKSNQGCMDSISKFVYVLPSPTAGFLINTNPQYLSGNNFAFTNTSTIGKITYLWDFGDGATSTNTNYIHSYKFAGSYIVTLHATSDFGCSDSFIDTVFVLRNPGTTVSFSVKNACVGDTVYFKNTSTITPPDSFLNFLWDFGDGNQTIVKDGPKHIYYSAGTYYISLTVLTIFGNKDTLIDTIEIYPSPTVNITAVPDTISIPGRPITLTANGIYDQLLWFDSSTLQTVVVLSKGKYWVTASFNNGCKRSDSIELTRGENMEFEVVTVFTPNGDGINDKMVIKNIDLIQPCKLGVYNRWGDELYSSKDYQNNWNGTYKGKSLPEGSYYYVLETKEGKVYKGAVNILR